MTEIRQVILAICGEIVPYLTERKGEVVLFHSFYKMNEQKISVFTRSLVLYFHSHD